MLNLNSSTLQAVADQALIDASAHPRWVNAIRRAFEEVDSNPYLERQDGHLLIGSPSGALYAANGVCSCEAYTHGKKPCWHRAAARLVRLHDEALDRQPSVAAQAPDVFPLNLPDDDRVEESNRLARKIAAARVTAQFNAELFA